MAATAACPIAILSTTDSTVSRVVSGVVVAFRSSGRDPHLVQKVGSTGLSRIPLNGDWQVATTPGESHSFRYKGLGNDNAEAVMALISAKNVAPLYNHLVFLQLVPGVSTREESAEAYYKEVNEPVDGASASLAAFSALFGVVTSLPMSGEVTPDGLVKQIGHPREKILHYHKLGSSIILGVIDKNGNIAPDILKAITKGLARMGRYNPLFTKSPAFYGVIDVGGLSNYSNATEGKISIKAKAEAQPVPEESTYQRQMAEMQSVLSPEQLARKFRPAEADLIFGSNAWKAISSVGNALMATFNKSDGSPASKFRIAKLYDLFEKQVRAWKPLKKKAKKSSGAPVGRGVVDLDDLEKFFN
jgi:hypothetical protein